MSAKATLLETRDADAGKLVESQTIEDMPLGDRRAMNLIEITGGAVFVNYDSGSKPNFSLAGGRTQSQGFYIDGGTGQNMRIGIGQMDTDPPVESLQEVKIMANAFSAEYGGSAGGVVIASTKSGTNQFQGSLFEYLRNQNLDAPNYFAPVVDGEKQKPALRYNVFGGTIGGPIRRDKMFFFFSYEGSRRRDGSIRTLTVPSLLQRNGDFTETYNGRGVQVKMYDPATSRNEAGTVIRDPFPGNVIPSLPHGSGRAEDNAFLSTAEPPRRMTWPGANNFRANDVTALTRDNFVIKVDHNLNSYDKLSGRYLYNSDNVDGVSVFPEPRGRHRTATTGVTSSSGTAHGRTYSLPRSSTSSVSPMRIASIISTRRGLGGSWPSKLGLKGVPDDAFPQFSANGFTALGAGTQERQQLPIQQYDVWTC